MDLFIKGIPYCRSKSRGKVDAAQEWTEMVKRQTDTVYVSDLLAAKYPQVELALRADLGDQLQVIRGTKDIWCRDYMPVQLNRDRFLQVRYDPDYLKPKKYEQGPRSKTRVSQLTRCLVLRPRIRNPAQRGRHTFVRGSRPLGTLVVEVRERAFLEAGIFGGEGHDGRTAEQ